MSAIGGFFELEINKGTNLYHDTPYFLSSARACLNLIIKTVNPAKIYLPYYSCNTLLQPIISNNVKYEFYAINEKLEPVSEIHLSNNEYFIYVNYYGLKTTTLNTLFNLYKDSLIVDNTQAFFEKGLPGVWSFNSARKFFGVPDGAFLYSPLDLATDSYNRNEDFHYDHLIHRLIGKQELAYKEFRDYEDSLNDEIKGASLLSEILLSNIKYPQAALRRKNNFALYHSAFRKMNLLDASFQIDEVPFAYPLLLKKKVDKTALYAKNIFIPTFWEDTLNRDCSEKYVFEKRITENLLPLPVDQRYNEKDIIKVIDAVSKIIE
jgi:hypothetical protein